MSLGSIGSSTGSADVAAPASPSASTFESEIDALLGEGFDDGGTNELPTSADGAPPTAPSETPSDPAVAAPITTDAAHAGAPPADAAPDEDPLKDATPVTYTVNGETRTFDGLMALGDRGAFITPDHLPKLQQRLSERDHYYEKDQANHQRVTALEQQYKALESLTAWNAGKDQQGNDRILTGSDGIEAMRTVTGRSVAALETIVKALDDPQTFASLVEVQQGEDGKVYILPNAQAVQALTTRAELAALRAEGSVKQHLSTLRAPIATPTPAHPSSTPASSELTSEAAVTTVTQAAQALKVTGLTPEDTLFLAEQLPRYIRPTTAAEKAQFGERIVDASFAKLIQREAARRAEVSQSATTATKVANENASKLAAALGAPRARSAPLAPTPTPTPTISSDEERWLMTERMLNGRSA